MKKLFYTLALAGLLTPALSARTLSVDEARANAAAYLNTGNLRKAPAVGSSMSLAGVINTNTGMPALYLFSGDNGRGLVIASASSEAMPVVGYADAASFNYESMPPSMKALLEDYASEIAAVEAGNVVRVVAPARAEQPAIEPLCKTQWNQNAPYNDLVPQLSGQNCMTGCVATAMAQVMKVFEWPAEHGEGFVSYNWTAGAQSLNYNLANSTLQWNQMLDNYRNEATDEQKNAVATLMRDCGYATEMQYSLTASGTTANRIPSAFYYNFGYDKNIHTLQRSFYTLSDWEDIVYNELKNGRPVIITGVSNAQGGHCFVCDGYSSDRYYHINWGWGGMSDGYFLLSALNPTTQGIGGSTGGFNNYVNICVGIQKPVEGSELYTEILADGNFSTGADQYTQNDLIVFSADAFYNPSMETENLYMGVKLTDAQGNETYIRAMNSLSIESYEMIRQYTVRAENFPTSGTYTVTSAWYNTDTEKWEDVHFSIDKQNSLNLVVEDGNLSFTPIAKNFEVKVTDVKLLTDLYTNTNFKISAKLVNSGTVEYLGELMVALLDGDDMVAATTAPFNVDIEGGDTQSLEFVTKFAKAPSAGTYYMCFINSDGEILSEPVEVSLTAVSGATSITLDNLRVTSGNTEVPPVVPQNDVSVAGTVSCNNGYYNDTLTAYVFPQRGGNSLATLGAETFFIHAGDSSDFEMHGSFGNGVVGTTYMIGFFNSNVQVRGALYFVLGDEDTSVKYVETPESVNIRMNNKHLRVEGVQSASINVYNASGACVLTTQSLEVDLNKLGAGVYVAVAQTPEGPVMLKFVL